MERLGLGPEQCLKRNPRLVYGRITGWGQQGHLAQAAGHDINYIAVTGALHAVGEPGGAPLPAMNLVGDFGGGGMLLALGVTSALLEVQRSGKGQIVDAAMTDGSALLMAMMYGLKSLGVWQTERGTNIIDGGAHFYRTYQCSDGKWLSVGAIEPQFYALLLEKTGVSDERFQKQLDKDQWLTLTEELAAIFKTKTRDEWCKIMENTDVCFAPVLDMNEAPEYPHNKERGTFLEIEGVIQPAPAPRFSRTIPEAPCPPAKSGEHTKQILLQHGYSETEIDLLKRKGII
jgi:alpha-methylacyl-CoA racemase